MYGKAEAVSSGAVAAPKSSLQDARETGVAVYMPNWAPSFGGGRAGTTTF